jgi:hypothetical protein
MLNTRSIPQFDDSAADWYRFLEKAAKGSCKAHEIVSHADMAYTAAVTGDPNAPAVLHRKEYGALLARRFPESPPADSPLELFEMGQASNWFPFHGRPAPTRRNANQQYKALWRRNVTVPVTALVGDALIQCGEVWSSEWLLNVLDSEDYLDYNSENVVTAMLMLALTWPGI